MSTPTSIAIITGSVGGKFLDKTILSVNRLVIPNGVSVRHLIVADGSEFESKIQAVVDQNPPLNESLDRRVITIPDNTGGGGYLCHRIIAAMSFLVNTTYMMVLDEDNEVVPHHIISHLNAIGPHRWSFTLRNIIDETSRIVCSDVCESMGNIRPTVLGLHDRLIDTNCYMLRVDLARDLAPLWMVKAREHGKVEADRRICQTLLEHEPRGGSTRDFTVLYRAQTRGGGGGSVSFEFFKQGNSKVRAWDPENRDVYVFHFDEKHTREVLDSSTEKKPLSEWCLTIFDDIDLVGVNLINGFECLHALPYDATCLINLCHPSTVPLEYLGNLKKSTHGDMTRIIATLEGPNMRHRHQWDARWVEDNADIMMTYSVPFLRDEKIQTVFMPHNARFVSKRKLPAVLCENRGRNDGSVAMVLENRQTRGSYTVCRDVEAHALDHLRGECATGFGSSLTVVGGGWKEFCQTEERRGRPVPSLGYDIPRHSDTKTSIDTYKDHDFALILENCRGEGASGYVSEKFADALIAGAIPLYWGENISTDFSGVYKRMTLGEGEWWIDIQKHLGSIDENSDERENKPLGEKLRAFIRSISPERIAYMKQKVVEYRDEYILDIGSRAYAKSLHEALKYTS
jgi:hypothetical protein